MGLLEQFFRLREAGWSGRIVTLGALAERCPVLEEAGRADHAAPVLVPAAIQTAVPIAGPEPDGEREESVPVVEVEGPPPPVPNRRAGAKQMPIPSFRVRRTGEASVIAPQARDLWGGFGTQKIPAPLTSEATVSASGEMTSRSAGAGTLAEGGTNGGKEHGEKLASAVAAELPEGGGELSAIREANDRTREAATIAAAEELQEDGGGEIPASREAIDGATEKSAEGMAAKDLQDGEGELSVAREATDGATAAVADLPEGGNELPVSRKANDGAGESAVGRGTVGAKGARRSGPCLEDPTLPPLQLHAQIAGAVLEFRPLVLGQGPAEMVAPEPMELRQIMPPPVKFAPIQRPALGAQTGEAKEAGEMEDAAPEMSPGPSSAVWKLEIVAEPGTEAAVLLAQIQALPGVIEAGLPESAEEVLRDENRDMHQADSASEAEGHRTDGDAGLGPPLSEDAVD